MTSSGRLLNLAAAVISWPPSILSAPAIVLAAIPTRKVGIAAFGQSEAGELPAFRPHLNREPRAFAKADRTELLVTLSVSFIVGRGTRAARVREYLTDNDQDGERRCEFEP